MKDHFTPFEFGQRKSVRFATAAVIAVLFFAWNEWDLRQAEKENTAQLAAHGCYLLHGELEPVCEASNTHLTHPAIVR